MTDIPLNLQDPDGFYDMLLKAHEGLSDEESERLNIGLVFAFANHIGNPRDISALIDAAAEAVRR